MQYCKIEVKADKENKLVQVRDLPIQRPKYTTWKDFFRGYKYALVDYHPSIDGAKNFAKDFGVSPTTLKRMVNKAINEVWYSDLENIGGVNVLAKSCINPITRKINYRSVEKYSDKLYLLNQLASDGMINVAPLLVEADATVEEFRNFCGKGTWKKLVKNSYYHNNLLAIILRNNSSYHIEDLDVILGTTKNNLRLKSSFAKQIAYKNSITPWNLLAIQNTLEKERKLSSDVAHFCHIVEDTERMANRLSKPFNPRWSTKTMKERHDYYKKLIMVGRFSEETFSYIKNEEDVFEVKKDGIKATLLKSEYDYKMEGLNMKHCIGGYANSAARKEYIAYHITSKDCETTCGFYVHEDGSVEFNQHYGYRDTSNFPNEHKKMAIHLEMFVLPSIKKQLSTD